ncbi:MAG: ATP phosphoribosyltransferase [Bacteroidales bacterium]|jgi:ATP phosphoribosyltransferase|nr:ATP phosphoribosyltransferase [Bacteroidales bacterium]MCR4558999.1 ATP phosphoribosyltransferase [Bacteroidales bacterium]
MERLKIAIQKSGRLSDKSIELFEKAGISASNNSSRLLFASASDFPIDILYLRDDDIPQCVADGVADAGIVGENVIWESGQKVVTAEKLGFGKCRLSLAIPRDTQYSGLEWFNGKKIATTYPNILKKVLQDNNLNADIHVINGSVEICPVIGLADAIFDIVSTGSTLLSNGLVEKEKMVYSEAVLIKNDKLNTEKEQILEKLLFRIHAIKAAKSNKYILLNAPKDKLDDIIKLLPGMKSPSVLPLADSGWVSVHSVVEESKFWDIIDQLRAAGAQGILVVPIEKMIL